MHKILLNNVVYIKTIKVKSKKEVGISKYFYEHKKFYTHTQNKNPKFIL